MRVISIAAVPAGAPAHAAGAGASGGAGRASGGGALALELPEMTRLLLVAAFVVSHNKPTLDRQVFDVKTKVCVGARCRLGEEQDLMSSGWPPVVELAAGLCPARKPVFGY
eukprot:153988-Chlamydomonas_euryale.AAC.3